MKFEITELLKEMLPIFISVVAGGIITIRVNDKSNKQNIFQNFKFDYYVKLHIMLYKLATSVADYTFNGKFEIEESLSISRYLNVEFNFVENIREEFKKAEDNIIRLQLYQSEAIEEIEKIRSANKYINENELYSDEKVKSLTQEFYERKNIILEKIMAVRNDVSIEINKYNK